METKSGRTAETGAVLARHARIIASYGAILEKAVLEERPSYSFERPIC